MTNIKELNIEELKKVTGGARVTRTVRCQKCGTVNQVEYDDVPGVILSGTCKNCNYDLTNMH